MADTTSKARRGFLKGALAALTTTAVAFPAATAVIAATVEPEIITETRVAQIFRRYNAALHQHHEMLRSVPAGQWTEASHLSPMRRQMDEARRDMETEPVTNLEDMALKVMVVTGYLSGFHRTDIGGECMTFLRKVV